MRRFAERGDTVTGLDCNNDYYNLGLKYARLAEDGIDRTVAWFRSFYNLD